MSGTPSLIQRISPSSIGKNPAATYSEWPVPEPKLHAPLSVKPPSTAVPCPLGKNWPPIVTRFWCAVNTSANPSSGRYAAAANDDGRFAIPTHPKEPSCHAISIQVSIISAERRLDSPGLDGIERRHQPAGPHRLDDLRREGACPFGLRGLGLHELAHAPCESDNPVSRFDSRRHVLTLTARRT